MDSPTSERAAQCRTASIGVAARSAPDGRRVAVAADHEAGARVDGGAVALAKVVEDDDVVAGGDERLDGDGADVAGAAGDEHAHHDLPKQAPQEPGRAGTGPRRADVEGAVAGRAGAGSAGVDSAAAVDSAGGR